MLSSGATSPSGRISRKLSTSKIAKQLAGLSVNTGSEEPDYGESARAEGRFVFECSWEVVNKGLPVAHYCGVYQRDANMFSVGGVYTVLRTKAPVSTDELGDQYCMLGPYFRDRAKVEMEKLEPDNIVMKNAIAEARNQGIVCEYGRWLIDGYPKVVLFDVGRMMHHLNGWKGDLYKFASIGVPDEDRESNDAVVFGCATGIFLSCFKQEAAKHGTPLIVAHFHEWQAGLGLVMCRKLNTGISTVFTTHATLLGRHLCAAGADLYNNIQHFNLDQEAGRLQIYPRYCIERASAHLAHVFTTVSEITALECEHLLQRKPHIITPNGLNVVKFAALHEFQNMHAVAKEKIHDFVRGHFHGHMTFDLDKTIYMFTAGRYEFTNKGGDFFIEALARLNYFLKINDDPLTKDVTVVAFIIYPARSHSFNVDSLKGQAVSKQLRDTITKIKENVATRMFDTCVRYEEMCFWGHVPYPEELLLPSEEVQLKRCILSAKRQTLPPICTHNMEDSDNDLVLRNLRRVQLFNADHDRVKVIFHPEFLSSVSPLMGLDYEEFVRGSHLGVFPSYYEPWGYTPAECAVMGVPSITTNLSGFGCFIEQNVEDPASYGSYVVDRRFRCPDDSINELAEALRKFISLSRRQRIIIRNRTERLSELLDWKTLAVFYREARLMALKTTHPDLKIQSTEGIARMPRPKSAQTTPMHSRHGSPDGRDSSDDDQETKW